MTNLDQDDRLPDEIDWQAGGDDQTPEESTSDADAEAKKQSEGENEGDTNTTQQVDAQPDEEALQKMVANVLKTREDNKKEK